MERVWVEHYPDGVPAEIDLDACGSIVELLEESVRRYPERPAFTNFGATLTYADLDRLTRAFGAWLAGGAGLGKGERVAIMMPNLLQYPVALLGALRAGLTVVNTNPLYTARELEYQLRDSGAKAIVIVENFAHVLARCLERTPVETVVLTRMGDLVGFPKGAVVNAVVKYVKQLVPAYSLPGAIPLRRALADGASLALPRIDVEPEDVAFLQYTGGTTGVAKGAMLTHRNMTANVAQSSAWLEPWIGDARQTIVTALPLYHIFALTANCLTFMGNGGLNHLITNPRDMRGFVKELRGVRFTAITGVNTLFNGLLNTRGFSELDFSPLRIALGGGMAVQKSVAERWKETTGTTLVEAYGLTETAPAVCINPLDLAEYNGSIGLPLPSTEVCVKDEEGSELGVDEPGELCVRGPQVMKGYWNRPDETERTFDEDGWLHTGDVATIDAQGYVRIVDRKKDVVLVSGFNVYPNEIESVVSAHPDVLEVGAIGVPDEKRGEAVKIVVVKRDPGLTEEDLRAWCRESLSSYKCPRHVAFTDELPKSNVGKILRRELRERFGTAGVVDVVCLDLEGVLVPEIWLGLAERTGIEALRRTTRDEPDYDVLMRGRLEILDRHGLRLADVRAVADSLEPLDGAVEFLDRLRERFQVMVLSDTFYEFAEPLMAKLGRPTLLCHRLAVDSGGRVTGYVLRQPDAKRAAVRALRGLNYRVVAAGDSYNDVAMLEEADAGILFRPPRNVVDEFPGYPVTRTYEELTGALLAAAGAPDDDSHGPDH